MDLTGLLPTSENGNKYILVVKDYKTKFVWIYAIKDKLATTINAIMSEELIPTFGPMRMLVTDRGTEFKNSLLKETCRLLKVERVHTTPSNPRSNGCVEKHNSTLKDMLSMYVKENQQDWDKYVRLVTMLYNSTVNTATGYTPYYLMFGREMNMTDDAILQISGSKTKQTYEQQSEELVDALTFAWEITTQREYQNYKSKNQCVDKRKRIIEYFTKLAGDDDELHRKAINELRSTYRTYEFREYKIDDWFYRKRHPVRAFKNDGDKERYKVTMKLQPRYDGPYRITGKINAVLYSAMIEGKEIRVHAVNMKPSASNEKPLGVDSYKRGQRKNKKASHRERNQSGDPKLDIIGEDQAGGTTGKETLNPTSELDITDEIDQNIRGPVNEAAKGRQEGNSDGGDKVEGPGTLG
jgi:transposase InsO family protein